MEERRSDCIMELHQKIVPVGTPQDRENTLDPVTFPAVKK